MKLVILVMGATQEPYYSVVQNGIMKTWGFLNFENKDIKVLPYYGGHDKEEFLEDGIHVKSDDKNAHYKTLDVFKWCFENLEFDYLIKTNVSTFIRTDKLYDYLLNKPREKYYAGRMHTLYSIKLATGKYYYNSNEIYPDMGKLVYPTGVLMVYSKDIIEYICNNIKNIEDNGYGDDASFGEFLHNHKFKFIDFIPVGDFNDYNLNSLFKIPKKYLEPFIYFRCKTERDGPRWLSAQEFSLNPKYRNDIPKMEYLYNLFY